MLLEAFEKLLYEIQDGLSKNAIKAIEASVSKSAKDVSSIVYNNIIMKSVEDYYNEYDPSIYKNRMYDLYNALSIDVKTGKTNIKIGYSGSTDNMSQHYSRSPRHQRYRSGNEWISRFENDEFDPDGDDNGLPKNEWILDNFWDGIHPRMGIANGSFFDDSIMFDTFGNKVQKHFDRAMPQISQVILFNVVKEFSKYF